jgi:hypothetical protein
MRLLDDASSPYTPLFSVYPAVQPCSSGHKSVILITASIIYCFLNATVTIVCPLLPPNAKLCLGMLSKYSSPVSGVTKRAFSSSSVKLHDVIRNIPVFGLTSAAILFGKREDGWGLSSSSGHRAIASKV